MSDVVDPRRVFLTSSERKKQYKKISATLNVRKGSSYWPIDLSNWFKYIDDIDGYHIEYTDTSDEDGFLVLTQGITNNQYLEKKVKENIYSLCRKNLGADYKLPKKLGATLFNQMAKFIDGPFAYLERNGHAVHHYNGSDFKEPLFVLLKESFPDGERFVWVNSFEEKSSDERMQTTTGQSGRVIRTLSGRTVRTVSNIVPDQVEEYDDDEDMPRVSSYGRRLKYKTKLVPDHIDNDDF